MNSADAHRPADHDSIREPDKTAFFDAVEIIDLSRLDEDPERPVGALEVMNVVAAPTHSVVGLNMVEVAQTQAGVRETGVNEGIPLQRYVREFWPQSGPQPWCAFFVSWCFKQVAGRAPPWTNPGLVNSVRQWATAEKRIVQTPLRGDMFGVGDQHMGLVARSLAGRILTIEGNASDRVLAHERPLHGLWFARP